MRPKQTPQTPQTDRQTEWKKDDTQMTHSKLSNLSVSAKDYTHTLLSQLTHSLASTRVQTGPTHVNTEAHRQLPGVTGHTVFIPLPVSVPRSLALSLISPTHFL
eukprot:GHVU01186887.1.p1 GENE.GHVU01186887.1~~GHVU01186887.1.p1  ORF type:complete len:104 (+),score=5.88 GHVU01186887.1:2-313(+)